MKILDALKEAECCLEERPCRPGSDGGDRAMRLTPYIRAAGWHRSGDIWVVTDTKAGHDVLVNTIDDWLPKLSGQLMYRRKTYPVLVHGVPVSDMDDSDITARLIDENPDTIIHPRALKHAEPLGHSHTQMPRKSHGSVLMHFIDPAAANKVIDHHIAFRGRILPTVKFVRSPPQCYRCQKMGHLARSCNSKTCCGICADEHDTRRCPVTRENGTPGRASLLRCASCQGSHTASDANCPVRQAAIQGHWKQNVDEGPLFRT